MADGGKRLNLILKDGKVSADIHKVPLKEVIQEIGRKCGILVEVYGKVDQDRLISTQFEDLPLLNSLYRLLRGTNFLYIEGERLCVLDFGGEVLKIGGKKAITDPASIQGLSKERGASLISEAKGEELHKSFWMSMISGAREEKKRVHLAFLNRGEFEL